MPTFKELDRYLQELLEIDTFSSIDTINGIQVSCSNLEAPVQKIAYAVDSSQVAIQTALSVGADILLVHHGFFWGEAEPIVGSLYKKIMALAQHNVMLYAIHLPLDAHKQFGNNAQIASRLKLSNIVPFGNYKEMPIGMKGILDTPRSFADISSTLFADNFYQQYPLEIIRVTDAETPFVSSAIGKYVHDKKKISKIAIISGSGTRAVQQAYQDQIDLYITGDASHNAWLQAKELEMNILFAGHYFTEIWGVLALGTHLQETFGIKGVFIHSPTGL